MRNFLLQLALFGVVSVCMSGCIYIVPEFFFWQDNTYKASKYHYNAGHYTQALVGYRTLLHNYPEHVFTNTIFYEIGNTYFKVHNYDSSIIYLRAILQRAAKKKKRRRGFDNTNHDACLILSEAYYQKGMYGNSLYYLTLSDTVFPFWSNCGNAYEGNCSSGRYLELYNKVGDKEQELKYLLRAINCSSCEKHDKLLRLKELLRDTKYISGSLDSALTRITPQDSYDRINYYFTFLNTTMWINKCNGEAIQSLEEAMNVAKTSDFYATIKSLE